MADGRNEADHTVTTIETRRKYGMYCCGLVLSLLLIVLIIVVILVLIFVEGEDAIIILPVLLGLLIIVATAAFLFVRWQHRQAIRNRTKGPTEVVHRSVSQMEVKEESSESAGSSWAFWRRTSSSGSSQRPMPTAPPLSTNTSLNPSEKSQNQRLLYHPVSTNADDFQHRVV